MKIDTIYDYVDESHQLLYQSIRYIPKRFKQRRIHEDGSYIWGISAGYYCQHDDGHYYHRHTSDPKNTTYTYFSGLKQHVPYRLPTLLEQNFILLLEGEKDVHTAEQLGFFATTNSGGVGTFQQDILPYFTDKYVAIIADNDKPGYVGAVKRAHLLSTYTKHIKVILGLPELDHHGDLSDWINVYSHLSSQELYRKLHTLIQQQPIWTPGQTAHIYMPPSEIPQQQFSKHQKKQIQTIYEFLARIPAVSETNYNHWQGSCPAHDDRVKSLSITLKGHRILIYCFAGCDREDIVQELGLTWKDLFLN